MYEFVIKNGNVIDGTGSAAYKADVAIAGGKIAGIGHIPEAAAHAVIDAEGRAVTPGFIDIHRHGDMAAFRDGFGELELNQGLTTAINGNCGMSAAPVDKGDRGLLNYLRPVIGDMLPYVNTDTMAGYLSSLGGIPLPLNCGMLVGCGVVWSSVLCGEHPTRDETRKFRKILERELASGAMGVSLGLGYAPECFLTTDELISGLEPLRNTDIPITFHMRREGDGVCGAIREVIEIGEALRAHVHISHLKAMGRRNWNGRIAEGLELISSARERGLNIACDVYPYTAGSTQLLHILPPEFIEGGTAATMERLKGKANRDRLRERMERGGEGFDNIAGMAGWENIIMSTLNTPANKRFEGMTVQDIARARGTDPVDCVCDMLIEESCAITMIDFITCEEDIARILNCGFASVISDSIYPASGRPHPRLYGTYARIIQRFVRERGDMTLEAAVKAMTSAPAAALNIADRGLLKEGLCADVNVFDPARVRENGSYAQSDRPASGMEYVFVNGKPAIAAEKLTNAAFGQVITG